MEAITRKTAKRFVAGKRLTALVMAFLLAGGFATAMARTKELVPVGRAVGIRLETDGVVIAGLPEMCADQLFGLSRPGVGPVRFCGPGIGPDQGLQNARVRRAGIVAGKAYHKSRFP